MGYSLEQVQGIVSHPWSYLKSIHRGHRRDIGFLVSHCCFYGHNNDHCIRIGMVIEPATIPGC